ncbi:MAG: Fe-S cluster assembly protein SufD [Firmicutes bacterium]|nr:Fe-S cluster assembly protein SufD [Bacillota bacterium]
MTTSSTSLWSRESLLLWAKQRGEPDWLVQQRLSAWNALEQLSWPRWERTDLPPLDDQRLQPAESDVAGAQEGLRQQLGITAEGKTLVLPGGTIEDRSALPEDVLFEDLGQAVLGSGDHWQRWLGALVPAQTDRFTALATALWQSGTLLYVPKGCQIDVPLESYLWLPQGGAWYSRTLLMLEPGAKVTLVLGSAGPRQGEVLHAGILEGYVSAGARLQLVILQNNGAEADLFLQRHLRVARDGQVSWVLGDFGGGLQHTVTATDLSETGASMESWSVMVVGRGQHDDLEVIATHDAPNTRSEMETRQVVTEDGEAVYQGTTDIHRGARGTVAYNRERTLLLSDEAHADALPVLRIDENDVVASHAASAGEVDPEQLFYLESRGIPEPLAIEMIVAGFLAPLLDRIPVATVCQQISQLVQAKLGGSVR